ncbi:phosphotransferase [Luteolibacter yonseiensis]|uniref:Phosphotransferase n=1 Tax=Luteolibacter yonseiensis TaxID=1144680 RepID=A0A934VAD3_9BACT|nr:phosphotransferase [Luteolibacter yonseiensis]MBK1814746.1 phosphotransferase [Luteolibacter yonseiensis]
MPTEAILSTTRQFLGVDPAVPITLEPIKRGASGRTIVRVKTASREPFIGIHWTEEREDNSQFIPVAQFLKQAKLRVPEIIHERARYRVALVEDLGDKDLLSLKDRPFEERLPYYRSAFEQVDKLFYAKPAKDFHLMPPFDASLYRWEQEYFFEFMVEEFLDLYGVADGLKKNPVFNELAERLGTVARHLVHRDFQSQNLMIKDDKVWLIDFQGLRRGRQEYDLASLIFDPYLDHTAEEREQLLTLWEDIADERPLEKLFHECAAQRLMQALGAYGNIVKNRGDDWYRPHIATAARLLGEVTAGTALEAPLAPVLSAIRKKNP